MTILGKLVVTALIPLVFTGFVAFARWCEEWPETGFSRICKRIFYWTLGAEIFFAILTIWGVH